MLEYLEKFKELPADIQQKASSQEVLLAIDELGEKYNIDLAEFTMRVIVGDVLFRNLLSNIVSEFDLEIEPAKTLEAELRTRVFYKVKDYLAGTIKPEPATASEIIKIENVVETAEKNEELVKKLPSAPEEKLLPAKTFLDDTKEIERLKKNNDNLNLSEADRYSALVEDILQEVGLNFPSESLVARFKQIITSYLRGIRTKIETKETVLKPVLNGGLNLDFREADRILAIANKKLEEENKKAPLGKMVIEQGPAGFIFKKEEIDEALGKVPAKPIVAPEEEYDLASEIEKGRVAVSPDLKLSENPPAGSAEETVKIEEENIPEEEKVIPGPKVINRTASVVGGKRKMEDIKQPQTMGPIDELAYMDLVTFRRLDNDIARRCKKIEEKINLLGKEGLDKQLEGIKAWRLNPVNKTYLSMGQESIIEGKNIDIIIADHEKNGLNYLTRQEFEEIMDLNNRLRF